LGSGGSGWGRCYREISRWLFFVPAVTAAPPCDGAAVEVIDARQRRAFVTVVFFIVITRDAERQTPPAPGRAAGSGRAPRTDFQRISFSSSSGARSASGPRYILADASAPHALPSSSGDVDSRARLKRRERRRSLERAVHRRRGRGRTGSIGGTSEMSSIVLNMPDVCWSVLSTGRPPGEAADDERRRPVRPPRGPARLRVVFEHEDGRLLQYGTCSRWLDDRQGTRRSPAVSLRRGVG